MLSMSPIVLINGRDSTNDWQDQTTIKIEREDAFKPDGVEIRDVYDAVFLKHQADPNQSKRTRAKSYASSWKTMLCPCEDFAERFEAIYGILESL